MNTEKPIDLADACFLPILTDELDVQAQLFYFVHAVALLNQNGPSKASADNLAALFPGLLKNASGVLCQETTLSQFRGSGAFSALPIPIAIDRTIRQMSNVASTSPPPEVGASNYEFVTNKDVIRALVENWNAVYLSNHNVEDAPCIDLAGNQKGDRTYGKAVLEVVGLRRQAATVKDNYRLSLLAKKKAIAAKEAAKEKKAKIAFAEQIVGPRQPSKTAMKKQAKENKAARYEKALLWVARQFVLSKRSLLGNFNPALMKDGLPRAIEALCIVFRAMVKVEPRCAVWAYDKNSKSYLPLGVPVEKAGHYPYVINDFLASFLVKNKLATIQKVTRHLVLHPDVCSQP